MSSWRMGRRALAAHVSTMGSMMQNWKSQEGEEERETRGGVKPGLSACWWAQSGAVSGFQQQHRTPRRTSITQVSACPPTLTPTHALQPQRARSAAQHQWQCCARECRAASRRALYTPWRSPQVCR